MKLCGLLFVAILLSIGVVGCAFDPPPYTKGKDEELDSLVNAYKSHNAKMKEELESRRLTRIKQLSVEKVLDGDGNAQDSGKKTQNGYVVSVSLDKAPVDEVIHQILEETKLPYFVDAAALNGYVSARFDKQPLIDALNVILAPSLLSAKLQNGIVVISGSLTDESIPSTAIVQEAVTFENLDVDTVSKLVKGLYPVSPQTGGNPSLNFGTVPNTNSIYLTGTKDAVLKTSQLLAKADREIKHIMMEVIIVEFDSTELEKLDANIVNIASKEFSGANLNFGSFASQNLSLTRTSGANNPTQFTALLDILISEEKAFLLSRPYIATLSGKEATINISTDEYVITETSSSGATITAPMAISSGVIMRITPTLLPDDNIRMNVYVEDSQSRQSRANVAIQVDKNAATTVMQVNSGETIIIGGLVLNRQIYQNAGVPFLRNVPVLKALFANIAKSAHKSEVAIYITPHIMNDPMSLPILRQEAFKGKKEVETR
ncbi:MAG: hypothetical protein HW390_2464 [Candidatus Brocadiaceae bacterium]|nr:hypothetical protein [Candidatus Brocadiaceae bacterium]